ncbi:hypothetical protein HAX54_029021, partial [Datura stramonium]|nr:hypothetical protein [Datura stramonium]
DRRKEVGVWVHRDEIQLKYSDYIHAHQGKRKEKRPAEVESRSNPELEESFRKVKEDEERWAELRRKRVEDALQLNAIPIMKESGTKHQKASGSLHSRICRETMKVYGVDVDCSAKAINKFYFGDDDIESTEYLAKLENPDKPLRMDGVINSCRHTIMGY